MTPEMEVLQKYAVEFMKKNIESSGDGDVLPYGFAMSRDGQYDIFAFDGRMLNINAGKTMISLMLLRKLAGDEVSATAFCSDSFGARPPAHIQTREQIEAWRETMPPNMRDWP